MCGYGRGFGVCSGAGLGCRLGLGEGADGKTSLEDEAGDNGEGDSDVGLMGGRRDGLFGEAGEHARVEWRKDDERLDEEECGGEGAAFPESGCGEGEAEEGGGEEDCFGGVQGVELDESDIEEVEEVGAGGSEFDGGGDEAEADDEACGEEGKGDTDAEESASHELEINERGGAAP